MDFIILKYSQNDQYVYINPEYIVSVEYRKLEEDTFVTTTKDCYAVKESVDEIIKQIYRMNL